MTEKNVSREQAVKRYLDPATAPDSARAIVARRAEPGTGARLVEQLPERATQ